MMSGKDAPPIRVIKSRRFMSAPKAQETGIVGSNANIDRPKQASPLQHEMTTNIRVGSKADVNQEIIDVRSSPERGHSATGWRCPLSADIVAKVFLGP